MRWWEILTDNNFVNLIQRLLIAKKVWQCQLANSSTVQVNIWQRYQHCNDRSNSCCAVKVNPDIMGLESCTHFFFWIVHCQRFRAVNQCRKAFLCLPQVSQLVMRNIGYKAQTSFFLVRSISRQLQARVNLRRASSLTMSAWQHVICPHLIKWCQLWNYAPDVQCYRGPRFKKDSTLYIGYWCVTDANNCV